MLKVLWPVAVAFTAARAAPSNESCSLCEGVVELLQEALTWNATEGLVESVARDVCLAGNGGFGWTCSGAWACNDLCSNIVKVFAPEILDIAGRLALDPTTDCVALGFCANTTAESSAMLTGVADKPLPATTASSLMRIVHLTDIHWDPEYVSGSNSDCGEPLCCRAVQGPPSGANTTCGYWGDYAGDTNTALLDSYLAFAKSLNPDVVFATGDDPPHNVWNQTQEYNTGVSINMTRKMAAVFGSTPVFPILGNHNGFPVNQYHTNTSEDQAWLFGPLAQAYAQAGWLDESAIASFAQAGYYTARIPASASSPTAMRVVALHPGLHVTDNFWTILDQDLNIANMTAWLTATLASAKAANETVYLLTHYPPNDGAYYPAWFEGIVAPLVAQYRDTIAALFLGHTHHSQVQVMWANTSSTPGGGPLTPAVVAYVSPAPTSNGGTNPSFRVYDVDRATGRVVDFREYRVDLAGQGLINRLSPDPAPQWELVVPSARSFYNMTDLRPSSWIALAERLRTDDALFHAWEFAYATGNPTEADYSDGERLERVCDVIGGTATLKSLCKQGRFNASVAH